MGQFSWLATDTGEQIANDRPQGSQTVTMVYKDQEGKIQKVSEDNYEGYGRFGGVDFYDAMVWMNPWYKPEYSPEELRSKGIDLYFDETAEIVVKTEYPQLYLRKDIPEDADIDFKVRPDDDPNQGWTMQDDEDEEEYWEDGDDWDEGEDDDFHQFDGEEENY